MKTKMLTLFLLSAFILQAVTLVSCKKINEESSEAASANIEKTKILNWLKSQETDKTPVKNKAIESLSSNLNFEQLSYADYNTEERKIIIPISTGFISNNNKGKNPVNVLLLTASRLTGQISNAEIVQFIPSGKAGSYNLKDIFSALSKEAKIPADGTFTFLSIGDVFACEKEYKNGNLFSYKIMVRKPAPAQSSRNNSGFESNLYCTHWYILTTYYYADGHEEYEVTDLGITCSSCAPGQLCDHLDDDGGGSQTEPDPGIPTSKDVDLVIATRQVASEDWRILLTVSLSGQKFVDNPNNNYFTNATAGSPGDNNVNPAGGGPRGWPLSLTYCTWTDGGHSAGLTSTISAVASGQVSVFYPNWQAQYGTPRTDPYQKSKTWTPSIFQ